MVRYFLRRLTGLMVVVAVVAITVFLLLRIVPGDPAQVMLGDMGTAEQVAAMREKLGLDRPLPVQFVLWLGQVAHADFGTSVASGQPTVEVILSRLEPTLFLMIYGTLFSVLVGLPLGILAADHHKGPADRAIMLFTAIGQGIPVFWLGLILVLLFAVQLKWLNVSGYVPLSAGVLANFKSMLLPAVTQGIGFGAMVARFTRATLLDILREDYIRTARAKGLSRIIVLFKHALRPALVPILSILGVIFLLQASGTVVVENVFNIPGVGRLLVSSVLRRDYPVVQGGLIFIAAFCAIVNFLIDLSYGVADPRVRIR